MYYETCLENPLQSLTISLKISIIDNRSLNMDPYLWCCNRASNFLQEEHLQFRPSLLILNTFRAQNSPVLNLALI